ncbi:hypothetical protein [Gracilimonas mengyeensis]|uniref:SusD family protein n=1 Tax=Gracilimonas mengyeensis TaxID=1302730 RepID=A0A521EA34_9BACT|nr:hypothetical protein [Gracilimonas mengyeensis]SMO80815.1 hypothetical protein SAMN06265219_11166 [Gracilimonas mengyeensis]
MQIIQTISKSLFERNDNMKYPNIIQKPVIRLLAGFLFVAAVSGGCNLLDVNNPNSLVEEDLENPAAAPALANGAEATLTNALGDLLAPYSTVTDELTWIGTRDGWLILNQGGTDDPINEFVDGAYTSISEARWTADNAIERLESFREDGTLPSRTPLVRSYLYGAITYLAVTDAFDNFVISDRQQAGNPLGEENLPQLISTAIDYLDRGIELADNGSEWETRLLAVRARAYYAQNLWAKVNPSVDTASPLVSSSDAVADAQEVINRVGPENDWRYEISVSPETPGNNLAFQVNERLELRIGPAFADPTSDGTRVDSVIVFDPIDNIQAPFLVNEINSFVEADQYANLPIISARELQLIIAEDALANNNTVAFTDAINNLRNLDNLSDYTGQVDELELLKHSRKVNLFLQGRRLADLYRFQEQSPEWTQSRVNEGEFFPITISEINSNPNVNFGD